MSTGDHRPFRYRRDMSFRPREVCTNMTLPAPPPPSVTVPGDRLHYEVPWQRGDAVLVSARHGIKRIFRTAEATRWPAIHTVVTSDPRGLCQQNDDEPTTRLHRRVACRDIAAVLDDLGAESAGLGSIGGCG